MNSKARRVLETKIRGAAQDAEGKIESELHQLYTSVDLPVKLPQSLCRTLRQVRRQIESIESNNKQHCVEPQIRIAGSLSQHSSEPKNDVMVGCDDVFDTIMHNLLSHSQNLEVISIVGMGGIGKTTLAQRLYEDATIISYFDVRAWTTVSQEHNLREMLVSLLASNVITNGNDHLANQLRQKLMGQRYLIVMDDIWSTEAWDDIHRCFPQVDLNGSRILLTTRLKQVAEYASSSNNNPHHMRFLSSTESWDLFSKKVFEEKRAPHEFETVGRGIVEKCQGLPLTIIVVAGLLTSFNSPTLIKCCKLHDLLHNFCLREAQRENLLDVINDNNVDQVARVKESLLHKIAIGLPKSWIQKKLKRTMLTGLDRKACRWISNHLDSPITHTSQECRSILYFPKDSGLRSYSFQTFPQLLRVLDISQCDLVDIPSEILNLVLLRYLALKTNASLHGYRWYKLQSLQTFIVETVGPNAPGEVWKSPIDILGMRMPHLRHVMFSRSSLNPPRTIKGNLETISCLYLSAQRRKQSQNFKNIPYVKKLGIYIDITPVSDPELIAEGALQPHTMLSDLCFLSLLENLKIDVPQMINFQYVFRLPTVFPPNIKKLTLERTRLPWDDMAIIAKLPKLESLKLKHKAFCGPEWKTTEDGFCELKYLKIVVLDLEHWSAHFPVLECLKLDFCRKLKEFPIGFADITTLQLIELTRCGASLVASAKLIQEELESFGHDKLVVRDYSTFT